MAERITLFPDCPRPTLEQLTGQRQQLLPNKHANNASDCHAAQGSQRITSIGMSTPRLSISGLSTLSAIPATSSKTV
jgi:hypothetical protein